MNGETNFDLFIQGNTTQQLKRTINLYSSMNESQLKCAKEQTQNGIYSIITFI